MFGVDAAEHELAALGSGAHLPVEPECEHGLVDEFLTDQVVPERRDVIDRDGVEGEAKNTIERGNDKRDAGLLGHLGELLSLDLETADIDVILGDETGNGTRTVLNGELGTVGAVRRGLGRVVLVVNIAAEHGPRALGGRDPEVAGAGVEENLEGLRRIADRDRTVVLGVCTYV